MGKWILRSSSHILGRTLLKRPETPLRGIGVGPFMVIWNGKPGDYRQTVPTERLIPKKEKSE